jgi:actin-related protein 8
MANKLLGRRKLIDRSYDLYDGAPNDPMSAAQLSVYEDLAPKKDRDADTPLVVTNGDTVNGDRLTPALSRQTSQGGTGRGADINQETSLASSLAGSPTPDAGRDTPQPGVPASNHAADPAPTVDPIEGKIAAAEERDRILPVMPLDHAIFTSIAHGAQSDERKMRDFLGGIMVVGGVANLHSLTAFLEERLKELRPGFAKDIMIGGPPRELDPQVVIWKGGSVFAKLHGTNDSWISQLEFDRLGSRVLPYKCIWAW